jgi:hypothetical protein
MPREKDIDTRVEELERGARRMADEIDQLARELRALGVSAPELNPGAPGRTKLSDEARLAALQRAAAKARASKPVGSGKGAVADAETADRLRSEAEGSED